MRFIGTLRAPRIDLSAYARRLNEELSDALAHAAAEWLGAATAVIPVWSGASLATFLPLAREVGFQLAVSPVGSAPNRVTVGMGSGTAEFRADASKGEFTFTYTTSLPHLVYNESHNANLQPDATLFFRLIQPGPYHFQQQGRLAFERLASAVRLPDADKHIRVKMIRVK